MTSANSDAADLKKKTLPGTTAPQILAFTAFVLLVALSVDNWLPGDIVTEDEFVQVKKLAVFLIAALLPSDAVIRVGRSIFLRRQTTLSDTEAAENMPATTLAQILAFSVYAIVLAATLFSADAIASDEFMQINDVAVTLIAALLPSEAVVRLSRALYLSRASAITLNHVKRI